MNTILLLKLAAVAHLGLAAAGLLMPRVVGMREHLQRLPKFVRQLFWVYYAFIGFCIVSFGLGTFFLAEQLAAGTALARGVCGFLMVFWTMRFVVGSFVFDLEPYLTNRWRRLGLHAAHAVFTVLPFVYGWVAFKPLN